MTKEMIIKAWKSEQYRHTLSNSERGALPEHPAGIIELDDQFLGGVSGAEEGKTWSLGCAVAVSVAACVSVLVGTCSPGGSLGCCAPVKSMPDAG